MSMKDTMTMAGGKSTAVNVNFAVGAVSDHVGNGQMDVMLVQTIFHYLARYKDGKPVKKHGISPGQLPKIDGKCGPVTKQAILSFQRAHAKRLLRVDGIVEPAKYDGRNITPGQRYLTITWMHHMLEEMALFNNESYFDGLLRITPKLRSWM